MLRLIAIVAIGLSAAGCQTMTTSLDTNPEVQRCRYEAKKAQANGNMYSTGDAVMGAVAFHSLVSDCLKVGGGKVS